MSVLPTSQLIHLPLVFITGSEDHDHDSSMDSSGKIVTESSNGTPGLTSLLSNISYPDELEEDNDFDVDGTITHNAQRIFNLNCFNYLSLAVS